MPLCLLQQQRERGIPVFDLDSFMRHRQVNVSMATQACTSMWTSCCRSVATCYCKVALCILMCLLTTTKVFSALTWLEGHSMAWETSGDAIEPVSLWKNRPITEIQKVIAVTCTGTTRAAVHASGFVQLLYTIDWCSL